MNTERAGSPLPLTVACGLWTGCAAGLSFPFLLSGALATLIPLSALLWWWMRGAALRVAVASGATAMGFALSGAELQSWSATVGSLPAPGTLTEVRVALGEPIPQSSPWSVGQPLLSGTLLAVRVNGGDGGREWIPLHRQVRVEFELAARSEEERRAAMSALPASGMVIQATAWWSPPVPWDDRPPHVGGRGGTLRLPGDRWIFADGGIEHLQSHTRAHVAQSLRLALQHWPDRESASVLACMVIGSERPGAASALADFAATGLTHLVAISGFNLAIIAGGVLWVGRWFRLRHHARAMLLLLGALCFALAIQPDISATRAAWMGILAGVLALCGLRMEPRTVLAWVAIALMIDSPHAALRPGFQLSFVAVLALLNCHQLDTDLFLRPWTVGGIVRTIAATAAEGLLLSVRIWIATTPIVWMHFELVSPLGPVLTLIASPVAAGAIVLGSLAAVASVFAVPIAAAIAIPAATLSWLLIRIAAMGASLPGAAWSVPCETLLGSWAGPLCVVTTGAALWCASQPAVRFIALSRVGWRLGRRVVRRLTRRSRSTPRPSTLRTTTLDQQAFS